MTEDQTREFLMTINAIYPSWNVDDPDFTVAAWHRQLKDLPKEQAEAELDRYMRSDKGKYPPNVSVFIPKQKEVYGFTGRTYSHDFFEQIEREVEENGGVY
jgi:hypothetical protein